MKQHITIKQVDKLSVIEKEKLRKWWKPKEGDWAVNLIDYSKPIKELVGPSLVWNEEGILTIGRFDLKDIKEDFLPILSIGQMIEFLGDDLLEIKNDIENDSWCVHLHNTDICKPRNGLCDTLWEAVKEVLEK